MTKQTARLLKGLVLLILIGAVSAGGGVAHYVLRGGDLGAVKQRVAFVLEKGKQAGIDGAALLETIKETADLPSARPAHDAPPSGAGVEDTGAIQVYFAPCKAFNPAGIDDAFLGFLRSAKKSIRGAFYELQWRPAAEVLIAQYNAGVDVSIVSDSDYANCDAIRCCMAAGIPVVFDEREPFMHNKFCVVDEARVWTGSTNISENDLYRNNNNAVLIASPKLAQDFGSEFEEMFVSKKFGKGSPSKTPFPEVVIDGTRIECYFAPEDHVLRHIMDEVAGATAAIDIMAFAFTSTDLAKAVVERIEHGVAVRGLFDERGAASEYSRDDYLAEHGARVFMDQNPYTMHNKVIIIDSDTVITGSYNFTQSAETKNDENELIIHSPAIAGRYRAEFESLLPQ